MQQDAEPHQSSRKAAEVRACFTFVCFNDFARQNIPHSNKKATPLDAVQKTTSKCNSEGFYRENLSHVVVYCGPPCILFCYLIKNDFMHFQLDLMLWNVCKTSHFLFLKLLENRKAQNPQSWKLFLNVKYQIWHYFLKLHFLTPYTRFTLYIFCTNDFLK